MGGALAHFIGNALFGYSFGVLYLAFQARTLTGRTQQQEDPATGNTLFDMSDVFEGRV